MSTVVCVGWKSTKGDLRLVFAAELADLLCLLALMENAIVAANT